MFPVLLEFRHQIKEGETDMKKIIKIVKDASKLNLKQIILMPLRWALTGNSVGDSVDLTMEVLGKERVLRRVIDAMDNGWN